jgi:hypothetical protein
VGVLVSYESEYHDLRITQGTKAADAWFARKFQVPKLTRDQARLVKQRDEIRKSVRYCSTAAELRHKKAQLDNLDDLLGLHDYESA